MFIDDDTRPCAIDTPIPYSLHPDAVLCELDPTPSRRPIQLAHDRAVAALAAMRVDVSGSLASAHDRAAVAIAAMGRES